MKIDPTLRPALKEYAKAFDTSEDTILEIAFVDFMARRAAYVRRFGDSFPLSPFILLKDKALLRGQRLFSVLVQEREENLRTIEACAGAY